MTSVFPGKTDVPRKSYITTEAPNGHIYSYTKSYNDATYTWSGSFSVVTLPTEYNVAGIVLRETGKKLYEGANPGVTKYMVGVFIVDQDGNNFSSGLGSMFIDPNCSVFAQFNGQRPIYIPTAQDDSGAGLDLGNPVYTRGDITTTNGNVRLTAAANGEGSVLVGTSANPATFQNVIAVNATATANNQIITSGPIAAGTSITAGTTVTAGRQIRCSTLTDYGAQNGTSLDIDSRLGQVFKFTTGRTSTSLSITCNNNAGVGALMYIIIQATSVNTLIDFNEGFSTTDSGIKTLAVLNGFYTFSFVSDGTRFYQIAEAYNLIQ